MSDVNPFCNYCGKVKKDMSIKLCEKCEMNRLKIAHTLNQADFKELSYKRLITVYKAIKTRSKYADNN